MRIEITWRRGAYGVDVPNYDGGVVVTADEHDHLRATAREADEALSRAISYLVAFGDTTPYGDDPRWSPWSRFQKPIIDRCVKARTAMRDALG